MIIRKSLKIPIHYDTTKAKHSILDKLTARITYGIRLISELITEEIKIDRKTIRTLVKDSDIVTKTGLSSGFIQQCIATQCRDDWLKAGMNMKKIYASL